ncbi:MAG: hypothetical protein ACOYJL_06765 [Tractidigestivibacter sp.]|jgi:hypothetical protein|uniref:hypothetical protein n=1 Tax=Tractidigestivibacter sp. TaxID=2847320 RepID=UPI003D912272
MGADAWKKISHGTDLDTLLKSSDFDDETFSEWVGMRVEQNGSRRSQVVRDSRLNTTFAYQIIAGERHASRDKLLQLAFGLHLDVADTCDLLERGGSNRLRQDRRRDAIIAYALFHHLDVEACDDLLWKHGEKTILPR